MGSPQTISLSGTGTQAGISLSSSALNFGQSAGIQNVTVTNTGNATLAISALNKTLDNHQSYTATLQNCSAVGPTSTCTIRVEFNPTVNTGLTCTGSWQIWSNALTSPTTFTASGIAP